MDEGDSKLHWIEVSVLTTPEAAEAVAHLLVEEGAGGVVEPAPAERVAYYPELAGWEERLGRIRRKVSELGRYGLDPGPALVAWRRVNDEDWAHAWKEHFHVLRLGRRIVVRPTWRAYDPAPGELVVHLDPGMAFGTGTHPTTAMCVEALERYVAPGDSVLDIGTGSGILAIVAARLGAARVLACDVDPVAVRVAGENAALNGVADLVGFREGSWTVLFDEGAKGDVAAANILAPVIVEMAGDARALVRPGGLLIASGILRREADQVAEALANAGWRPVERAEKNEWAAIVVRNGDEH